MSIKRGDIVSVNFPLPGGPKEHPVLIISNNEVHNSEDAFIGVMMSGNPISDKFTFEIDNSMVTKAPKKKSQIRCHLIALIPKSEINSFHGNMISPHIDNVIDKIYKDVLH